MAKLGPIHVEITPAILVALVEQQSALIVDRDKYKNLYESSQDALTDMINALLDEAKANDEHLGKLRNWGHELDSLKGATVHE